MKPVVIALLIWTLFLAVWAIYALNLRVQQKHAGYIPAACTVPMTPRQNVICGKKRCFNASRLA